MAVLDKVLHLNTARTVSSFSASSSAGRVGLSGMENNCNSYASMSKFKRRKVSAIRDFPPGCGRFAQRINLEPKEAAVKVGSTDKGDAAVSVKTLQVGLADSGVRNESESCALMSTAMLEDSKLEKVGGGIDVVNGLSTVDAEQAMGMQPGALDDMGKTEPRKTLESEPCDLLLERDCVHADDAPLRKGTSESNYPCSLKKLKARKYPPRRKISAIRDFPYLCGINALVCEKKVYLNVNPSLKDKKFNEESCLEDGTKVNLTAAVGTKLIEGNLPDQDFLEGKLEKVVSKVITDDVRTEFKGNAVENEREHHKLGILSERNMKLGNVTGNKYESPPGSQKDLPVHRSEAIIEKRASDSRVEEENLCKEIVVYNEEENLKRKHVHIMSKETPEGDDSLLKLLCPRVIVQGLMAAQNCPWQQSKWGKKLTGSIEKKKAPVGLDKAISHSRKKKLVGKATAENTSKKRSLLKEQAAGEGSSQLVCWENWELSEPRKQHDALQMSMPPREFSVNPPPFGHGPSKQCGEAVVTRNKVRETLRLFQAIFRKLLQEEETKPKDKQCKRIDINAAVLMKKGKRYINTGRPIVGPVPGVEVGDEFQYRVELNIIGLHRHPQGGIDYIRQGGKIITTSVVSSGAYADDLDNSGFLIYTGQGGNVLGKDKMPEDQKLERGNLALKNSMAAQNPVRVIRGLRETRASDSVDGRPKTFTTYTYDGLYLVEKCWQETGPHGKLVFKFLLNRIPGQPELSWKAVKKSKKFEVREGLCLRDISEGKESIPICAVNTIDKEKPPPFNYITRMIYPTQFNPIPSEGCDCSRGCSDSEKCACAMKNGGEIPYNHNGAIVEAKPLVYECGPHCKCPPSCHNRVAQHGIKFQLEIFKTESRGWGVRSVNSIPSGSFICEYIGELLEDKEAEERTGNDEYLFDIGTSYSDNSLHDEVSSLLPDVHKSSEIVEDVGFTIDAAKFGNIGRFVNHSCSPNLYAQNVLYDHGDKRVPHIMFFAAENIPPLQELTYHYNYMIGQVRDSNGDIKKKSCYCGSSECTGRMY